MPSAWTRPFNIISKNKKISLFLQRELIKGTVSVISPLLIINKKCASDFPGETASKTNKTV